MKCLLMILTSQIFLPKMLPFTVYFADLVQPVELPGWIDRIFLIGNLGKSENLFAVLLILRVLCVCFFPYNGPWICRQVRFSQKRRDWSDDQKFLFLLPLPLLLKTSRKL